jgi:hypothetical protein
MITTVDEANEIMVDTVYFDFLQLDEQYAIDELEGLAEKVKDGFTKESKKYEFNIPVLNVKQLNNIVKSLSEIKNEISDRVVNI